MFPVSPWNWISEWLFQGSDLRNKVDSRRRIRFGSALLRNWKWFLQDGFDFLGQVQVFQTGQVSQDRKNKKLTDIGFYSEILSDIG
jgi:hypothetical protein